MYSCVCAHECAGIHKTRPHFSEQVVVAGSHGSCVCLCKAGCTVHSALGIGVPKVYEDFGKMWAMKERIRLLDVSTHSLMLLPRETHLHVYDGGQPGLVRFALNAHNSL